jgi:large subunit ribosomal protein L2
MPFNLKSHHALLRKKNRSSGRNNSGVITIRHRGGSHKRHYRLIDFSRDKPYIPAKVKRIEYDPNRSAHVALLSYRDGEKRYIIAPKGLKVGVTVISGVCSPIEVGNSLPICEVPEGVRVHCVESKPNQGAKIARSAGTFVTVVSHEKGYVKIRLKSGRYLLVNRFCLASIGEVSSSLHYQDGYRKAGRKRWFGIRPTVRGVAMNPIDHPHGGGEGKTSTKRHPVSPWGMLTKGYKTRKQKRLNKFIK